MTKNPYALMFLRLAGCGRVDQTANQASWAEDRASANLERTTSLEDSLAELKQSQEQERAERARLERVILSDIAILDGEAARLTSNDEAFIIQIDYLRALHGSPTMQGN